MMALTYHTPKRQQHASIFSRISTHNLGHKYFLINNYISQINRQLPQRSRHKYKPKQLQQAAAAARTIMFGCTTLADYDYTIYMHYNNPVYQKKPICKDRLHASCPTKDVVTDVWNPIYNVQVRSLSQQQVLKNLSQTAQRGQDHCLLAIDSSRPHAQGPPHISSVFHHHPSRKITAHHIYPPTQQTIAAGPPCNLA